MHFVHERGKGTDPLPIVLTHGFPSSRVQIPSGFAVFADSYRPGSARPPRELAEHFFHITRWAVMPRGGHFAALEEPQLLAEELREFFRPLRAGAR